MTLMTDKEYAEVNSALDLLQEFNDEASWYQEAFSIVLNYIIKLEKEIENLEKKYQKVLEKDIAKEPAQTHKRYGHGNEYDDYYCPECDKFLAYEPQGNRYKQEGGWSRCIECGQKIIWKDKK